MSEGSEGVQMLNGRRSGHSEERTLGEEKQIPRFARDDKRLPISADSRNFSQGGALLNENILPG